MTVGRLKEMLDMFPQDLKVAVEVSGDYREFKEAKVIVPGKYTSGMCGGDFEYDAENPNAIVLR